MTLRDSLVALADAEGLGGDARALLWAAYDSETSLGRTIAGEPLALAEPEPAGQLLPVWLSSITVEGFRGIGTASELLLSAKPGLTLVVGRNGSGKSSFAEGLEALLTGDSLRWRDRPPAWRDGWRNIHHQGPTQIGAELLREGSTSILRLSRRWQSSFEGSALTGALGETSIDVADLAWEEALTSYKPFLSYNELGSMLEQVPSAIYDSMAGVLGLDRLTTARERLRQARLHAEAPAKELGKSKKALLARLQASTSGRAAEAAGLMGGRSVDLDRLEAFAAGSEADDRLPLVALSRLAPIDVDHCVRLGEQLGQAIEAHGTWQATDAGRSRRIAELLRLAVEHHDHEGSVACPVCGDGRLDEQWRATAVVEASTLEREAQQLTEAARALDTARNQALLALTRPPDTLRQAVDGFDAALLDQLRDAWQGWATAPSTGWTDDELVDRLGGAANVNALIEKVRLGAESALAELDAEWQPLAGELVGWIVAAREAATATAVAGRLKAAEEFCKRAEESIRNERFQPIADRATHYWDQLRQQSNISLERVALEGRTTRRRVDLDVTVDGTDTSALGVMSQGELHALALALFVPRVTAPESPFRFLLIDDPVQAMDPARVDGLARVLESVAGDRQVVVFTHDDRLPASCRRLGIPAEVVEVSRQTGSRVTATPVRSPAETALSDARALAKTSRLPPELRRQIVPIHCRQALEAKVQDLVWQRLLAGGRTHAEIDGLIGEAETTAKLLSLLLFGECRNEIDQVYDRLDQALPGAARQVRALNKAVHEPPADLDPTALTGAVGRLIADLDRV